MTGSTADLHRRPVSDEVCRVANGGPHWVGRRLRTTFKVAATQEQALLALAGMVERATIHPAVVRAARQIVSDCQARDDMCELQAIYDAVKHGDPRVAGLERGVRYTSDARFADQFNSPSRMLAECAEGACAGDCDDQAALIASLAGAVGFRTGLRAYGPKNGNGFSHVYAVAYYPKKNPRKTLGLDASVPEARVGWQPPRGRVVTAMIE